MDEEGSSSSKKGTWSLRRSGGAAGAASVTPAPRSISKQSSTSSEQHRKWDLVRDRLSHGARQLGKHTKQFVGLEPTQSQKDHWEAVQCSIVVHKLQENVAQPSVKQSIQPSLMEAIKPHESISPGTTKNLLRQLSRNEDNFPRIPSPPSSPSRGLSPVVEEGQEMIELESISPRKKTRSSDPAISVAVRQTSGVEHSLSEPAKRLTNVQSSISPVPGMKSLQNRHTGRAAGWHGDSKPDLWKVALISARMVARKKPEQPTSVHKSFRIPLSDEAKQQMKMQSEADTVPLVLDTLEEKIEDEESDKDKQHVSPPSLSPAHIAMKFSSVYPEEEEEEEEDIFFGVERDQCDGAMKRLSPSYKLEPEPAAVSLEGVVGGKESLQPPPKVISPSAFGSYTDVSATLKRRRERAKLADPASTKQYRPSSQALGGITFRLLNFRFKKLPRSTLEKLNELEKETLHRPYFTYWLMFVHLLILIVSLAVYGFAPYGFDQFTVRALVQQSNLAVDVAARNVTPNIWGGPTQEALVLLGAKYGPCMRRDRQLFEGLEESTRQEASESGCCVRRDSSGCVQVPSADRCPAPFADFVFTDPQFNLNTSLYSDRAVCGTSPRTCTIPSRTRDKDWQSNITGWPICQEAQEKVNSSHLTCNITGRPCCVGIQAHCLITTLEDCDFRQGRFHPDAFLCSQVDCLDAICGLLPFANKNVPDQGYRIWIALFVHAGIIHFVVTSLFSFFVLRHVESYLGWLRTSIIYIGSGIGGNLVSAFFVPYNPEVGPAGSIFGIIAFLIIYIIYQAHRLQSPLLELLKLLLVILALLLAGLFPFIDNYAHFGGFLFGFILSGIFVQYVPPNPAEIEFNKVVYESRHPGKKYKKPIDWIKYTKLVFVIVGIPLVLALYALFLALFYAVQETWDGFRYLNCVPLTPTFCLDFGQTIRSRDIFL